MLTQVVDEELVVPPDAGTVVQLMVSAARSKVQVTSLVVVLLLDESVFV
jgi:hypothetical protein